MKHSLLFATCEQADKAQTRITNIGSFNVSPITDIFQTNDGESRDIELRFFTKAKLSDHDVKYLIKALQPHTSTFNYEECLRCGKNDQPINQQTSLCAVCTNDQGKDLLVWRDS